MTNVELINLKNPCWFWTGGKWGELRLLHFLSLFFVCSRSSQYGTISLVCLRMSCGVIEGCGSGWVDSCQGKIKRVSSGVGERGASDGGPRCSNPTGWITWPLYNCVRGALPTALSLLNWPGLAQQGSCLPPSLLSPPSCSFPILHFFPALFPCSLLSCGWCRAVSPLIEGETITSHQSPSSPQGACYCYGDPLVAFAHSDLFTFFFPLFVTMGSTLPQCISCSCRDVL